MSLSAPMLNKVFSFCIRTSFSDLLPFALRLSEKTNYLKFHQVSLCVCRFGRVQDSK